MREAPPPVPAGRRIVVLARQAATFSAGGVIIHAGVRGVLAEIVPAFEGISEKLVKNAKPALDVPIVFPFAPNAVLIGFLASFVGGIVGMLGMAALGTAIVIPGVVAHFMTGAPSGVIGKAVGGRRGAVPGAFVNGVAITFLPLLLSPVLGDIGLANSTFADGTSFALRIRDRRRSATTDAETTSTAAASSR